MRCLARWLPLLLLSACGNWAGDLHNAESLYRDARYEAAHKWLRDLEPQTSRMDPQDRAAFYYLRGMTAYRLGQREDALYYLSLAAALADERPALLKPAFRSVMERTMKELTPKDGSAHARNPLRPDSL